MFVQRGVDNVFLLSGGKCVDRCLLLSCKSYTCTCKVYVHMYMYIYCNATSLVAKNQPHVYVHMYTWM